VHCFPTFAARIKTLTFMANSIQFHSALSAMRSIFIAFMMLLAFQLSANEPVVVETSGNVHTDSAAVMSTEIGDIHAVDHSSEAGLVEGNHSKKFDPGMMIMDHISDTHDWHLFGHLHIPLPVILYTNKGLEVFSSAHFKDSHAHSLVDYHGNNYTYRLVDEEVVIISNGVIDEAASSSIIDLSITKNIVTMFVVFIIMLLVFTSVAKAYRKRPGSAPKGLQSFIEPLIVFVRDDIAKPNIGVKYEKFMPYLLTVFFFIWISNLLGLVPIFPGGANLTGNIAITLTLSVLTFIITNINGNKHYWGHIFAMPGVPKWVLIILTPIEILSLFLRPFVLMIRLFANISAGHIIALAFFSLIFIFGNGGEDVGAGMGVGIVSWAFTVFMTFLELLVAFLQAFVFALLSAVYIGSAVEESHHEEHAEHAH
jgi:F-type H+-transporting ATPase subunit a